MRVLWAARRSNQFILTEINPEYSLERLMLKQTPGDSEGQGSLACCSPWGSKESDITEQLNKNNK